MATIYSRKNGILRLWFDRSKLSVLFVGLLVCLSRILHKKYLVWVHKRSHMERKGGRKLCKGCNSLSSCSTDLFSIGFYFRCSSWHIPPYFIWARDQHYEWQGSGGRSVGFISCPQTLWHMAEQSWRSIWWPAGVSVALNYNSSTATQWCWKILSIYPYKLDTTVTS